MTLIPHTIYHTTLAALVPWNPQGTNPSALLSFYLSSRSPIRSLHRPRGLRIDCSTTPQPSTATAMPPTYTYSTSPHEPAPSSLPARTRSAITSALAGPTTYLFSNPTQTRKLATKYAVPLASAGLASPLLSLLPLGPLGPLLGLLATAFARFKVRQNCAGSYYALLHAAGLAGVRGQVCALLSFMSLGAVFGASLLSFFLVSPGEVDADATK